jgi:hypothetical protein
MRPLSDTSAASAHTFVTDFVEPGAKVIIDGWKGDSGIEKLGYIHRPRSQRATRACGEDPGGLLPGVHRVAPLVKRWLFGSHQGAVYSAHLANYLNEFVCRLNRPRSRSSGMLFYRVLELPVAHEPVRYKDLVVTQRCRKVPPTPPRASGHPPRLDQPPASRPWGNSG